MQKPWLRHYPEGVPHTINTAEFRSISELLDTSFKKYADRTAFRFMGHSYSFQKIDQMSLAFATYLQRQGLRKGDRVAIMMPNVPQYPVVAAAILRAGMVVVNVNPLYTPRELEHQLRDSGARLIVILENFAHTFEKVQKTTQCPNVVLASVGDMLSGAKGHLVNFMLRRVRKQVPAYVLKNATSFKEAIKQGNRDTFVPTRIKPEDLAALQYTGGTTGVSKGATLLHRNLVANVLQCMAWYQPALSRIPSSEQPGVVCALPLYHVYAFSIIMLLGLTTGSCQILIPNPRDLKGMLKTLSKERFHTLPAVNTLFNALARDANFDKVDWRHLKLSISAGMATQKATADLWHQKTGCAICEGYGLSETSPMATANPINSTAFSGSIGLPVCNTDIQLLDELGQEVALGEPGEIAIRGPQVMAGYWNRPEETKKAINSNGYFLSGDIGVMDERGYIKIVDRKKDMILVSGFNVYPNEIEDVMTQMPGVVDCAAVGVADAKSGEAVKVFVVRESDAITEQAVRAWCEANLTAYKRPRYVAFINELPKSPIGKVLRKELRDPKAVQAKA